MKLILKLAWRNIWRNKRRSILTLGAIAFATFIALVMRGLQIGTYDVNIDYSVNMFSGYMQVQEEGYQKDFSINKNFKFGSEIRSVLDNNDFIVSYAPRISGAGLVSFSDNSQGAFLVGFDPKLEKATTKFMDRIVEGKFFSESDALEVVLGYKLLNNLKAKIGDEIVILSQGIDGSLGNLKFKIVGTTKFGNPEIDQMGVFIGLYDAQELLAMYGRVNAIAIKCASLDEIPELRESLSTVLPDEDMVLLDWMEVSPELKEGIELDNAGGVIMLFILLVIVAFGILNTVLMSVTERFKEFGISLSIGMPQKKLVNIIIIETMFIALLGLLIGNIFGYALNYYFTVNPIDFSAEMSGIFEEYGFLPVMKSTIKPIIYINTSISIIIISVLASIYPAYRVYKLEPLKGIRYT